MSEPVKPRRPYRSPRRQEQAAQTRSRILAAARELLVERGYAGTTIASVAERAETAAETVYAVFRTKQALLEQAVRKSVRGEDEAPVLEQPGPQLVAAEQDQREQVRLFATDVSARLERASPLLAVLAEAARSEAALAALAHELQQARRRNLAVFVDVLTANGPLRLE